MALAPISNETEVDELFVGFELDGRYSINAVLARMGALQTVRATDRWLEREVALALSSTDGGELISSGKAVARITSPHVVNVFGCGEFDATSYVVFEQPALTLATYSQKAPDFWSDDVRVSKAAEELVKGLVALRQAGVATSGLHLGSIGVDASGRIQLSPWPLIDPTPALKTSSPLGDVSLVTSFLEVGGPSEGESTVQIPTAAPASRSESISPHLYDSAQCGGGGRSS